MRAPRLSRKGLTTARAVWKLSLPESLPGLAGKTIEVNENAEADEFHARSVPEQGFDELQTTNTELKAEQGFDELRRTTSKEHHQRMLYTPHCQTLVLPVTVNILQRRRLSGRLFEKLCHSPAETFGSQGS